MEGKYVNIDGAALKRERVKRMLSQGGFATLIGQSSSWVSETERDGKRRTFLNVLGEIASKLRVDPQSLRLFENQGVEFVQSRKFPVFNVSIPAGHWTDTGEGLKIEDADGWQELPIDTPDDAFCLRIRGDCMEPDYPSGSILVFVPIRQGERGVRQFESGRDYYFEHSDGKATFKRVFYDKEKERFRLECLNKKYKALFVPEQMLARMSRAIKMVRDLT